MIDIRYQNISTGSVYSSNKEIYIYNKIFKTLFIYILIKKYKYYILFPMKIYLYNILEYICFWNVPSIGCMCGVCVKI